MPPETASIPNDTEPRIAPGSATQAVESAIPPLLAKILDTAIAKQASDVHFNVGRKALLGLDGRLAALETEVVEPQHTDAVLAAITPEINRKEVEARGGSDFSLYYKGNRFRVSAFRAQGDVGLVLRLIPAKIRSMDEIGLPAAARNLVGKAQGLVLVAGPTGSGKTTTLASMIDVINQSRPVHILTIEDPIEYVHSDARAAVTQRQVGQDVPSFAEGVWRGLRMAPNVILVGEMRNADSIRAALRAAETGHLVFSTIHANTAASTVQRVVEEFPTAEQDPIRYQLANTLLAVINQRLLRRIKGGRVAAYEFLLNDKAVANHIRHNRIHNIPSEIQTGGNVGMQLLDDEIRKQLHAGEIDQDEASFWANDPDKMGN